ncbi:hypothetical protein LXL04_027569 [Taraxacum kok-saghyz]
MKIVVVLNVVTKSVVAKRPIRSPSGFKQIHPGLNKSIRVLIFPSGFIPFRLGFSHSVRGYPIPSGFWQNFLGKALTSRIAISPQLRPPRHSDASSARRRPPFRRDLHFDDLDDQLIFSLFCLAAFPPAKTDSEQMEGSQKTAVHNLFVFLFSKNSKVLNARGTMELYAVDGQINK